MDYLESVCCCKVLSRSNEHKRTDRNLRENVGYLCKTFIHRFDSDRRLYF